MQHIHRLTISLEPPESFDLTPGNLSSIGPYLQGVLMERVDPGYAGQLHQMSFNPYSQYCFLDKGSSILIWRISALTDDAARYIIEPMRDMSVVRVRSLNTEFRAHVTTPETMELKKFTDMIYGSTQIKTKVHFLTPTAFKSSGTYVFIPTPRLIFQNLIMHYSQIYEGDNEVDPDTVDYIDQHARITAYHLRSQYFDHAADSGKKIPAFVGSLTIGTKGPQALTGLAHMLLSFGEYAGIGIKTSMGMGGVTCSQIEGASKTSAPTAKRK